MTITIREITADEWPTWRTLRLRALRDAPESFESTYNEEADRLDDWWIDLIGHTVHHPRGALWFAESDGTPVGAAFSRISPDGSVLHIGAMWVSPEVRRQRIGGHMLDRVIEWGTSAGVAGAALWVTEGNVPAERLYRTAGFTTVTDRKPLRDGSDVMIVRLIRDLCSSETCE